MRKQDEIKEYLVQITIIEGRHVCRKDILIYS